MNKGKTAFMGEVRPTTPPHFQKWGRVKGEEGDGRGGTGVYYCHSSKLVRQAPHPHPHPPTLPILPFLEMGIAKLEPANPRAPPSSHTIFTIAILTQVYSQQI